MLETVVVFHIKLIFYVELPNLDKSSFLRDRLSRVCSSEVLIDKIYVCFFSAEYPPI